MKYRYSDGADVIETIMYIVLFFFEIGTDFLGVFHGWLSVLVLVAGAFVITTVGLSCMALWDIRSPEVDFPKEVIIKKVKRDWRISTIVIVAAVIFISAYMEYCGVTVRDFFDF